MKKVAVGLSGGVDSAVTAYLLKQRGYEVLGYYFILVPSHEKNIDKVKKLAFFLNIPLEIVDLKNTFQELIINGFLDYYFQGKTPNPCVWCNAYIKFPFLFKYIKEGKADYISTGHYVKSDGNFIYEAKDKKKDQSYFLSFVRKNILPYCIFPLGDYEKNQVKKLALQLNLPISMKESQDICFLQGRSIGEFLEAHKLKLKGYFVLNKNKQVLRETKNILQFTVGQRRGLHLRYSKPLYVKNIDIFKRQIIVAPKEELYQDSLILEKLNLFMSLSEIEKLDNLTIKIRYKANKVEIASIEEVQNKLIIKLKEKVFAITPGQVGVIYHNNKVVAAGEIAKN